jgi:RNA polymerase sigma-70 factor (ECF subfamily)
MAETIRADEPSDRSLLRRVKAGEEDAATRLYLRYAGHLRSLASAQSSPALAARMDPEDIVQSVFRTFFRRAARDGYDVPEGEDLWRLFLVIALRKIRNAAAHHRAARRDVRRTTSLGEVSGGPTGPRGDAGGLDLAVLRMVIDDTLARLPEAAREIVQLRVEGHEVAEIASRTGRSKRSVERLLQRFRDELRGLLDDEDR